ncbi:MAG: SDR family NAD(P)-dependent oxidoreductase [Acidimicrobiales bacterium]
MTGGTGTSGADARPVALVTGSSSGIGEAIARRLAVEGMLVVVHSRSSVVEGEALAAEIGGSDVRADLRAEDEARHLVRTVLERHQCLDVLVNNAGVSWRIPFLNTVR